MSIPKIPFSEEAISSNKMAVFDANTRSLDEFMNSGKEFTQDRNGDEYRTRKQLIKEVDDAIKNIGYVISGGTFESGATLTQQNSALLYQTDNQYYQWTGALPKIVPPNSAPQNSGGIGNGAWILAGDSALKKELSLSSGSFSVGYQESNVGLQLDNLNKFAVETNKQGYSLRRNTLNQLMSKMAAGEVVKIACYGDSTTDGYTTTDWVINEIGKNHNLDAPNSWPVQLQTLLRDMYANQNIAVFNAGFNGKAIADGWATSNYKQAIVNNPFYGKCDIVFIGFGLNDIVPADNQVENHINQSMKLIEMIIDDGSLPILLTSNVTYCDIGGGNAEGRDKHEVAKQINEAKKYLADFYNIPLFDLSTAMLNFVSKNNDGYKWGDIQPDALHFGDVGHKYQACWLASQLYSGAIRINDNNDYESVSFMDYRSNVHIPDKYTNSSTETKYGKNVLITPTNTLHASTQNTTVMDLWVWNECNDASIVYRQLSYDYSTSSYISVINLLNDNNSKYPILSFSLKDLAGSGVDTPRCIQDLSYGLNRIKYIPVTGTASIFFGFFDFVKQYNAKFKCKNILYKTGVISYKHTFNSSNELNVIYNSNDVYDMRGDNTINLLSHNKKTHIKIEGILPEYTGLILTQTAGIKKGTYDALVLYRSAEKKGRFLLVTTNINNNTSTYRMLDANVFIGLSDNDAINFTLSFEYNETDKSIDIESTNGSNIIESTHKIKDYIPPISGVFGNFVVLNVPEKADKASLITINTAEIRYE